MAKFKPLEVSDKGGFGTAVIERLRNVTVRSNKGYTASFSTGDVVDRLGNDANKAFKAIAPEIEAEIKELAPVDTGRLQDSVAVNAVGGRNPRIDVSTVGYGIFVENGTSKMEAQPFIRPVIEGKKTKWARKVASLIKQGQRE